MQSIPKFNQARASFHATLKTRIQQYFDNTAKATTGNTALFIKGAIFVVAFIALYIHLVFFTPNIWVCILECVALGGLTAGIGFNVMHDGAHGSFSKYGWVNKVAAFTLNVLGGSSFMWNVKHNIIHHAYTNVEGLDDDIDIQPWMRMTTLQKKYKFHKYQYLYFWILYSLLYVFWIFVLDYQKYFKQRIGAMAIKKMKVQDHLIFWGFKIFHLFTFIFLPIYTTTFLSFLVGFLIFTTVAGFTLSIVFQLAHTVEHTHFPVADEATNKFEDEWAVHQIKTTANFATQSKLVSWLVGGLNFQIEHHLFPKISHIHYPQISKIIKEVCAEFDLKYIEYKRLHTAFFSHVRFLKRMGIA
jgi:linoleoyl-CoA desaturase